MHNGQEKKTGKGIKRDYLKKNITHADYVKCIQSQVSKDQQQMATFNEDMSNFDCDLTKQYKDNTNKKPWKPWKILGTVWTSIL